MEDWLETFARANFLRSGDTAHDLKTPLNIAVLNLELLRMRVRKLVGHDDEKLDDHARAIESELRRMARIVDAFFLLSTPPRNDEQPTVVDVAAISTDAAASAGYSMTGNGAAMMRAHESRIRQALKLFFEGASAVLRADGRRADSGRDAAGFRISVAGQPEAGDFELTKLFKFYYTDPLGNPNIALATARLIAETYGGELNASEESGKVSLRLNFPLGDE
ncbi:MAG TPA: histidine kinase dimerization/phospho-acceptor domain-containing protein [Thermoanaerobaculia bacterium]|nr:histidine kinase dimerization/phospho-acceptor domain-containing protein [Thermoanaerobaculia bacterium]